MTAVCNTSPINYLVLIGLIEILPKLFSGILIPRAVLEELEAPAAPLAVRGWVGNPPAWLHVESVGVMNPDRWGLDPGESEVIALAERRVVKLVLLDERKARRTARERGLLVAGTLGVLERSAELGMIDIAAALERLQRTSFRASPSLIRSLLAKPRKQPES